MNIDRIEPENHPVEGVWFVRIVKPDGGVVLEDFDADDKALGRRALRIAMEASRRAPDVALTVELRNPDGDLVMNQTFLPPESG